MATDNHYIQRRLITALAGHLNHKEITMLVGPRQSGKTTILKKLETELRARGQKTLYLNLDFEDDFHHVSSQGALQQKIHLELGSGGGVVFIDEIQKLPGSTQSIKLLSDITDYLIVATGSSELRAKTNQFDTLAGRFLEFILL